MNTKSWQLTPTLPFILLLTMSLTRFDHFGNALSLPDASLAVFFFAGFAFKRAWLLGFLLLEAGLIDYIAIEHLNVSDFCVSPAYLFLIPAYSIMWFTGRFSQTYAELHFADTIKILALAITATVLSFSLSNGSFYVLSGRFGELSVGQFLTQFSYYITPYITSSLIYIAVGLSIIKLWKLIQLPVVVES